MLQFISHYTKEYSYLDSIRMALEGGCRWVQLRMKGAGDDEVRPVATAAQRMCHATGATFILDDRVELAKELRADGVHLGLKDMPIAEARHLLGDGFIIGGTANTIADVRQHHAAGADYIGCGPFRFTTTKKGLSPVLGLDGYRGIMQAIMADGIRLPVVAIGGITADDIPDIMQTGVSGVALSGAVLRASDPVAEIRKLIALTS
ncbi:thiamine phosphate synthase [Prevotella sp. PINT]|uniref:thiamine phosphate synthase n=1 Tax=Palleniella intestinalis TaxID=2736291 RepID=UPI001551E914|nr:thiamine phosphate synthase [Palleniella intestinalis]NPD80755.1 thiamine phosphate synthase [Palleniella intestinalis]